VVNREITAMDNLNRNLMLSLITARRKIARLVWFSAAVASLTVACESVPLLAPTGSTITLTTGVTALPVNGSTEIIAQLLEAAGTPPHSGTHVSFIATLGTVAPRDAETDVNGRVIVRFLAGDSNGTATITATSGGASTGANGGIKIAVGTAAVGRVTISANPASVPSNGGSTTIVADVFDINGNALNNAPVSFTTTAGSLANALVITNAVGRATTTLTTSQQATVTGSVGAQAPATPTPTPTPPSNGGGTTPTTPTTPTSSGQASGSVTVTVNAVPTLVITPPETPPSAGLPAAFKFAVTVPAQNGSAVREVTVDWGDGDRQNLGAVTGDAVVSHVYEKAGTYPVTGTVTDTSGNTSTVSTSVTVIPVPAPTVVITFSPIPARANTVTTFTIQVTVPAGISVVNTTIAFGDGQSQNLGGLSGSSPPIPHVYTSTGTFTASVTVTDSTGRTTIGSTSVSVSQ
jgi:PKD domain/Bacterial Ig-like domain (group 1)